MPNNDKELQELRKKRMKANQSAITASAKKQQEEANASAAAAAKEAIPFRNADIDRMIAKKKKMF